MLPYLSPSYTQRPGGGGEVWPNLQDTNLLDITLELPSNSFRLNHDSAPVLFILLKPLS